MNSLNLGLLRVALRIPAGWRVDWHELYELDPDKLGPDDERWDYLQEDLLQLREVNQDLLLDVGWYPSDDPEGRFGLVLLRGTDWNNPIITERTRDMAVLIECIERILLNPRQQ